jgi:putative SOS response-associated peptidase YedK
MHSQVYGIGGEIRYQGTIETFSVISTDPNELIEPLHNRMHAILQAKGL